MDFQPWFALIPVLLGVGAALPRLLTVRSQNRRTDAETVTKAYGHVIDRHEAELIRQQAEITGLRSHVTELLKLISSRDEEIVVLRQENVYLKQRVTDLE